MESYREFRDRQQKEFNELPLGFAFSDKQFDEMMGKWGLDPEKDLDKIYRIPGGGFIQKKDHKHFHEVLDRHNAEMEAAKAADEDGTGFLYQMFKYELDNHEYGYTGELEDTLDCLGLTWEELKASPVMLKALDKQANETFKGLSITHQMLVFLHGSIITVGETYDYSGRYAKEKADKLLKGYEALELFGWFFEMDEEKQVLDGTSELFAPAEEK